MKFPGEVLHSNTFRRFGPHVPIGAFSSTFLRALSITSLPETLAPSNKLHVPGQLLFPFAQPFRSPFFSRCFTLLLLSSCLSCVLHIFAARPFCAPLASSLESRLLQRLHFLKFQNETNLFTTFPFEQIDFVPNQRILVPQPNPGGNL
jgi:hypothetical protein